ncbi:MAG: aminodeoxychorismate synthase component I [Campylobacterota bacterium]|nr:aminodeoxychorismate synthase component I [Campylobacterota bacterium]
MFETITQYASTNTPFLFYTNYKGTVAKVYTLDELEANGIEYSINAPIKKHSHINLNIQPISLNDYKLKFNDYIDQIKYGNTYLGNLTQPTPIHCDLKLEEIYKIANATYKLHVKDQFVCFSPEPFISIENNTIKTFPMKGTIDASTPNAKEIILKNKKEMAEHIMIVDLLRNDLSMVANNVKVNKFRYIQKIKAGEKELLHVSSEISGQLKKNWRDSLGEIIKKLLPAGSISGTPKINTVKILDEIEQYDRKFFSGIFGVYDGKKLETSVMIRFIEKKNEKLIYKSGGGITLDSDVRLEYQEMLDKIYIP